MRAGSRTLTHTDEKPFRFNVIESQAVASQLLIDDAGKQREVRFGDFLLISDRKYRLPIYAHALVGMVTFVGQWWTETRKPSIEQVASHIAALAWMGLRHLPKAPSLDVGPQRERRTS